jgi:four helix bundle protein
MRGLSRTPENRVYGGQLIRASSSMGANYQEACGAESNRDFVHKIRTVLKEGRESRHWLRLIYKANGVSTKRGVEELGKGCVELIKIFKTIINKFHS